MQIGGRLLRANDAVDGPLPMIGNREQHTDRMFYNLLWQMLDFAVCLAPGCAKLCQPILLSQTAIFGHHHNGKHPQTDFTLVSNTFV